MITIPDDIGVSFKVEFSCKLAEPKFDSNNHQFTQHALLLHLAKINRSQQGCSQSEKVISDSIQVSYKH